MNVNKVKKTVLDCGQLANKEEVSNSLEKMQNCLQIQLLVHVANKGSTVGTFCASANNVIKRIQTCKKSSNAVDEFKDCLIKRILELKYGGLKKKPCKNKYEESCNAWQGQGLCEHHRWSSWMSKNCTKACKKC